MFSFVEQPGYLLPGQLDAYLEKGWFRMNQKIFTTHFLQFDYHFYNAIWLRVNVHKYIPNTRHNKLLAALQKFTINIKPAEITPAHEELYDAYKTNITFDAYNTLQGLLYGTGHNSVFNTRQVNIYDGSRLIATGYFDVDINSAEGIVNIYHPGYKKYSLGKCLQYIKIDYCKQQGLQFFYPGYAVPGYKPFDYKLTVGVPSLEYYHSAQKKWVAFKTTQLMYKPLEEMADKLTVLNNLLAECNLPATLLYYLFFDAVLTVKTITPLLGYPVFLQILPGLDSDEEVIYTIVFDAVTSHYVLIQCIPVYNIDKIINAENVYARNILCPYRTLFETKSGQDMVKVIQLIVLTTACQHTNGAANPPEQ